MRGANVRFSADFSDFRGALGEIKNIACYVKDMIKTISISLGLVGLTAFSGMALSMAHDLSFGTASRVAPEQIFQAGLAFPTSAPADAAMMTGPATLEATDGDAQVVPAIMESVVPYNRLSGKSIATASRNAPTVSVAPMARFQAGDHSVPRDVQIAITRPVYSATRPTVSVPRPIPASVSATPTRVTPEPDYLIGVYR